MQAKRRRAPSVIHQWCLHRSGQWQLQGSEEREEQKKKLAEQERREWLAEEGEEASAMERREWLAEEGEEAPAMGKLSLRDQAAAESAPAAEGAAVAGNSDFPEKERERERLAARV